MKSGLKEESTVIVSGIDPHSYLYGTIYCSLPFYALDAVGDRWNHHNRRTLIALIIASTQTVEVIQDSRST